MELKKSEFQIRLACRAAVVAMLVEFWFDGGLFKLATASVFWILFELGSSEIEVGRLEKKENVAANVSRLNSTAEDKTSQSLVTSAATK